MSLIERALGKAKLQSPAAKAAATAPADSKASDTVRVPVRVATPRIAENPQVLFTNEVKARLGLQTPPEQEHQRAAEFRHIKRRVIAEIRTNRSNRILLVASALAGDGKSFTSANLARSLALEPDFSVLLVDADVIKPHLTRSVGLFDRPGLMNALVDEKLDIESLVLSTDIEGLSFLPAGGASEFATEYFASERMHVVLETLLAVPNRILVIDSLPLLMTTEARALAPLAGQVLLVVRAEATSQAAVKQALELLDENTNVKLLLNAVVRTNLTQYLGYGYGYEYSETASEKRKKS